MTTKKDPHPENIDIEIDRESLCKYLRLSWIKGWFIVSAIFGFLFGIIQPLESIDKKGFTNITDLLLLLANSLGISLLISSSIVFFIYLLLGHWRAKKTADALYVKVEGSFLRVISHNIQGTFDRKVHFRSITDYSTIENRSMKKHGIKALQMNTTGGTIASLIRIDGVKDCDRIRDLLAEVDELREG